MSQKVHDYYQKLAPEYDRDRFGNSYGRYVDRMERSVLRQLLQGTDPDQVVEFACGTGRLLEFAATGVDRSDGMLAEAARKWPDRRLITADAATTGLPDASFQVAYAFHLFMHLDRREGRSILDEAARIIRPGGRFIFDIPSAPRRSLTGRPPSGWHGDTALAPEELQEWIGREWRPLRRFGTLFFPIHHIPDRLRSTLVVVDRLIGSIPLSRWSSYYIVELERVDGKRETRHPSSRSERSGARRSRREMP